MLEAYTFQVFIGFPAITVNHSFRLDVIFISCTDTEIQQWPIRKLLVKKLKLVLDNKTKPRNSVDTKVESRRSLARYSSGEESDLDATNSKEKRGRRATTGGSMLPPTSNKTRRLPVKKDSPVKRDSDKGSESEEEKSPVRIREKVETVTTRHIKRTYTNDQDDYETGSDSDVDSDKKTNTSFRSNSREQVSYAKDLLKVIHPELTSRIASYKCGKPGVMPHLTEKEIIDIASARAETVDISQCRTDLNNLQVLIVNNPRWGLSVVQLKSLYTKDVEHTPLTAMENVVQQRNKGSVALTLTDPSTPISCLFVNTLYSAGSTFIVVGLMGVIILGLQRLYKYYVGYQKKKNEEIYSMVEQIIDIISQETEDSGEPYISVDHVRDTLISPQNREKMASTWDAAVKFIQKNESRVRMEVQSVDGEDCRVWRWISPHGSPKRSAAWQGQAFETQEGSVNNLTVSPTPCLKIRHMFDKNDTNPNLRAVIQDAILEKCGDRCNILHIDIERTSCCVYVKCATPIDAGVVYRSLHGWWYEGRLITVKYLRLERYMQRFPNSPSMGPFLKPSRQRRLWEE
ncbi:unnamed protein product, partial [Iphiclides podalirius]